MRAALAFVFFGIGAHLGSGNLSSAPPRALAAPERPADPLASVEGTPLVFVKNRGQIPPHYRFHSVGFGQTALFADSHVVLSRAAGTSFVVSWDGARPTTAEPGTSSKSQHSFLYGKDEANWHRNVAGRSSIIYRSKYDGIDLHFSGENGGLKSTYYVDPGTDPLQIRWRYLASCPLDVAITESGELSVVDPEGGAVATEAAPIAWQTVNGARRAVPVRYALFGDASVGFQLGAYDPSMELVIDPDIEWATFLGGNGTDHINDIDVDSHGMVYLTGYAHSKYCDQTFPTLAGDRTTPMQWWYGGEIGDAFVVKIDPNGRPAASPCPQVPGRVPRLVYSTRLGGGRTYVCNTGISCADTVNSSANCCPVWMNDPTTWDPNCAPSSIVTSIGHGSLDFAAPSYRWYLSALPTSFYPYPMPHPSITCAPGVPAATRPHGADHGFGIAVDTNGEAVIVGRTESDDFPGTGSASSPNPALTGALNPSWQPALGSNYVGQCGPTALAPFADAFIARLNATGTRLIFSTYFGGVEHEEALAVDLDSGGNAYVVGLVAAAPSSSITPPNWLGCPTPTGMGDGFILKFDPSGVFAGGRYLGGTASDVAIDVAVGPSPDDPTQERVHITGTTRSPNFVTVTCSGLNLACASNSLQGAYAGHNNDRQNFYYDSRLPNFYGDGWVARYSLDLITCETFTYVDTCALGSSPCSLAAYVGDEWVDAIAVDSDGIAWITASVGSGEPPIYTCAGEFAHSMGVVAGLSLTCNQPQSVVAATTITGEHAIHPFDLDVDDSVVYVTGAVARFQADNPLPPWPATAGLTTVNPLNGTWVYGHEGCNGNLNTRHFDLGRFQPDSNSCATIDGFVAVLSKTPSMPPLFMSYLGGEGFDVLHAIAKVEDGFIVGGLAGKPVSRAPRKNWLCEPQLYNANEVDVPTAPGHCMFGGGYGPVGNPNGFNNVYQGSRYATPGTAEAYLAYIRL